EQVDAAVEKQREEGGKFGSVLVRERFTTPEEIKEVITFQITETLVQLFSWKEGKYEFKPMRIPLDKEIGVELNTEHFLMEGVRLVDEWSEIKDKISIESVFAPREVSAPVALSEEEQRVMSFVDGENDVGTIADISGIDSFQVSVILLGLLDKKLVTKKSEQEEEGAPEEIKPPARPIPGLAVFVGVLIVLSLAASIAVYIMAPSTVATAQAWEEIESLRIQIQKEYYLKGAYPASLDKTDPWGNPFIYSRNAEGFTLSSAGPDGRPDTDDDIR
ncbi:MAG: DUF4388 domain-containing protein, partial [Desulfobacterales bacterium]|nr:DUF4388 domain-containing protein [Desulfobacterales bacterium]